MTAQERRQLRDLVRSTRGTLRHLQSLGISHLALPSLKKPKLPDERSKASRLEPWLKKALACQACRLAKTRHQVVFGEGNLDARLVFVGEGPGQEEDLQGRPFVGRAGELLTQLIRAMNLSREAVYITNVVKCRPPMNRPPAPDEVHACRSYLEAQLAVIQPRVICALGKTAASALLGEEAPLGQLRGKIHHWKEIPLVVTFHPAYLLRNPPALGLVRQDMQRVLRLMNDPAPASSVPSSGARTR